MQHLARNTLILVLSGVLSMSLMQPAAAYRWDGPCEGWRYGETVTRQTPVQRRDRRMTRLIVCVFQRWAPGEADRALEIAWRESNRIPWAKNPWTHDACRWVNPFGSCGLYQHLMRYWGGRVRAYLKPRWFPHKDWPHVTPLDPRANSIAAAKMVARYGWTAWGG